MREAASSITAKTSSAVGAFERERAAGLDLHGDRRDVVRNGVVQLTRNLLPLTQPNLLEVPLPRAGPIANGGAERVGEEEESAADQRESSHVRVVSPQAVELGPLLTRAVASAIAGDGAALTVTGISASGSGTSL